MEGNLDFEVEYEIVKDEEEHDELGGLAFEPKAVDPVSEQAVAKTLEPMDIDKAEEQDPELEIESEAMSSEEDQEQSENSSESSGSDPNWCPNGDIVDPATSDKEGVSFDGIPVEYGVDEVEPMDMEPDDDELE
ncbi:hypothetical protein NL676_002088 [Syzygium grande]|nr:hypothetical protein NL676_002088 [Syzygium grande]